MKFRLGWAVGACLAILAAPAWAAIEIEPLALNLSLLPGRSGTEKLSVRNTAGQSVTIGVVMENWYPGTDQDGIKGCITATPSRFQLQPQGRQEVVLQVAMPEQASRECLVMVFFSQDSGTQSLGPAIRLRPRIGIPLYLFPQGKGRVAGEITALTAGTSGEKGTSLRLGVKNTGTVHWLPFGAVEILSPSGESLRQQEVRFNQPVFPDRAADLTVELNQPGLAAGEYQAKVSLVMNSPYQRAAGDGPLPVMQRDFRFAVAAAKPE